MNPADLTLSAASPTLANKALSTPQSAGGSAGAAALKNGKILVPRVDCEAIYTQLKAALGQQWAEYKLALNAFVLGESSMRVLPGNLNQAELSWVLQPLLSPAPSVLTSTDPARSPVSTLHLHNTLLAALYANTLRDLPPSDVAPWVVATDKPTATSKNAGAGGANDKAEERLKRETMALHARDRKRLKSLKEAGDAVMDGLQEMTEYRHELAVKPPESIPQTAAPGGLTKTNWDLEIRRRYAQPLAAETLEFPTHTDVQNRIEPICYEAGLAAGPASSIQAVAEYVELATEAYLKEILGQFCGYARANAEGSIATAAFRRQLRKEEDELDRGVLQRNPVGLLPVEMEARAKRDPVQIDDLRVALQLHDAYLARDQFLRERLMLAQYPDLEQAAAAAAAPPPPVNGVATNGVAGAHASLLDEDAMLVDEPAETWKGGARADRDELMGILDDCLAVG
nr:hypothetical protein CFP56_01233 [Quercus suber]